MTPEDMNPWSAPPVTGGDMVVFGFQGAYRFLSNFYTVPVPYAGLLYPSAEHAYQAAKTLDPWWRNAVANCPTPGEAKRMGREVPLRPGWDGPARTKVMLLVVTAKFFTSPEMARNLAATRSARLVEANSWHDNFWGDCTCGNRPECGEPGRNLLGLMLEGVRLAIIG